MNTLARPEFFIGFDQLLNQLYAPKRPNFPPYDIEIVDAEKQQFKIIAAVAGYKRDDISITLNENKLLIEGALKKDESKIYQTENIAKRSFKLDFTVHQYSVVTGAKLENGLLEIDLHIEVPEDKKPRQISINA